MCIQKLVNVHARVQRGGGGGVKGGVTGVVTPPKFIRSKIFWVNLWQLYYSDSTVFKFRTSMWLFSALAPALYKGCGLLAAIIFFSVPIQQDQHNVQMLSSTVTFDQHH